MSEAEALAAAGIDDIFVTNEVVEPAKLRARRGAGQQGAPGVLVDRCSASSARRGDAEARQRRRRVRRDRRRPGRCGVAAAAAGALAQQVAAHDGACASPACRPTTARRSTCAARRARGRDRAAPSTRRARAGGITAAGHRLPAASPAPAPAASSSSAASGVCSELQAGSYLFMDRDYADNAPAQAAPRFEHALFVKSQVMSRRHSRTRWSMPGSRPRHRSGMPRVWQRASCVRNGGDEHGILRPPRGGRGCRRSARRSGWCPDIAIPPSTCTTSCCASAATRSRRSGPSRHEEPCCELRPARAQRDHRRRHRCAALFRRHRHSRRRIERIGELAGERGATEIDLADVSQRPASSTPIPTTTA